VLWCACTAFQSDSGIASIVARDASAPARILIGGADAAAGLNTLAEGCFPAGTSRTDKYWSPVGRVDNVYGDRNLVCSCPPIEDYAQAAE
jgi:hypothetical protein